MLMLFVHLVDVSNAGVGVIRELYIHVSKLCRQVTVHLILSLSEL